MQEENSRGHWTRHDPAESSSSPRDRSRTDMDWRKRAPQSVPASSSPWASRHRHHQSRAPAPRRRRVLVRTWLRSACGWAECRRSCAEVCVLGCTEQPQTDRRCGAPGKPFGVTRYWLSERVADDPYTSNSAPRPPEKRLRVGVAGGGPVPLCPPRPPPDSRALLFRRTLAGRPAAKEQRWPSCGQRTAHAPPSCCASAT